MNKAHEAMPFIQRVFRLAADEVGGTAKLCRHLGLTEPELRPYLSGEAMPPLPTLLAAVELVVEHVNLAERPWQSVLYAYERMDHRS